MSIVFFEGFETVGTELGLANQATTRPRINLRWDSSSSGGTPTSDSFFLIDDEFSEGFAINMGIDGSSAGNFLGYDVELANMEAPGASFSEWVVGFRLHVPIVAVTETFFLTKGRFGGGSGDGTGSQTDVIGLSFVDSTDIQVNRADPGGFVIDTALAALTPGAWHYVEIRFKIAESADSGRIEVWVDNALVSDTVADTNNDLTTGVDEIQFHSALPSATVDNFTGFDDIYILWEGAAPSTSRLGPTRVRSLPITSDVVGEWDNVTETTLATTLDGAAETQVDVGTGNIPSTQPATGNIQVTLDTGQLFTIAYTSHDGDGIFTTASTNWTNPNDSTAGVVVLLPGNGNFDKIDENGADADDYVETDVQLRRDRYNITDLVEDATVWAVKIEIEAINMTGGVPVVVAELKSGATVDATEIIVSDTSNYSVFNVYYDQDPNTGTTWLTSAIDAMTAGFLFDNKVN